MKHDRTDGMATLARLKALMTSGVLPNRALRRCETLYDRLRAPVRVAILGAPGTGKRHVFNALASDPVLPCGANLPPLLLRYADAAQSVFTLADGRTTAQQGQPALHTVPMDVMLVELGLPLPALVKMSLLNVAVDAAQDLPAALRWVAPRCDIAVWCTRAWSVPEQQMWAAAPDALKNHAVLVSRNEVVEPPFEQGLCRVDLAAGALPEAHADRLRAHLCRVITQAKSEDRDLAELLLAQFDAPHPARPEAPEPQPDVAPEARAVLSRLFLHLRQSAVAALTDLPETLSPDTAAPFLASCEETFETLQDIADADPALADHCPALGATLREASELMLLMRIEGGAGQANEAALLMGQVRRDIAVALAA